MPFVTRPRKNALPEATAYLDTGCSLNPLCLECPEPTCRHDTPLGPRGIRYRTTRDQVAALLHQKLSARDISHQAGVGIRTVFRIKRVLTRRR